MFQWLIKKTEQPKPEAQERGPRFSFRSGQMLKMHRVRDARPRAVQTVVQDVEADHVSVLAPARREDWSRGSEVQVSLYAGSGLYSFRTNVLRAYVKDNVMLLDLAKPKQVRRFQRRRYKRASVECTVTYDVVFDPTEDEPYTPKPRIVTSRDLSAAGICIRTERLVSPGSLCSLAIVLPGTRRGIGAVAKVLESRQDAGSYRYATRMEFVGIMDKNRILIDDVVSDMGGV
jgi:c-di-GMP-binding flagellar brake protein YcgR